MGTPTTTTSAPVKVVTAFNCANCKTLGACIKATKEALDAATKALAENTDTAKQERLENKLKAAKKELLTQENAKDNVCDDFSRDGRLPTEVTSAMTLLMQMDEGKFGLFQFEYDKLAEKRILEEELGVAIGDTYYGSNGKPMGIIIDLSKDCIRVRTPENKRITVKVAVKEEEDEDDSDE